MTLSTSSAGGMEVDEDFFSTETSEEQKDCPLKRGSGSQRKTFVLVIGDFKASAITGKIKAGTNGNADVTTDGLSSYASFEKKVAVFHHAVVADNKMKHLKEFVKSVPDYRRTDKGNYKYKLEDILLP